MVCKKRDREEKIIKSTNANGVQELEAKRLKEKDTEKKEWGAEMRGRTKKKRS